MHKISIYLEQVRKLTALFSFRFQLSVDLVLSVGQLLPAHQTEIDIEGLELHELSNETVAAAPALEVRKSMPQNPEQAHKESQEGLVLNHQEEGWANAFQDARESGEVPLKGHSETNGLHQSREDNSEQPPQEQSVQEPRLDQLAADDLGREPSGSEDSWGDSFQEAASDSGPESDAQPTNDSQNAALEEDELSRSGSPAHRYSATATTASAGLAEVGANSAADEPPSEEGAPMVVSEIAIDDSSDRPVSSHSFQPSSVDASLPHAADSDPSSRDPQIDEADDKGPGPEPEISGAESAMATLSTQTGTREAAASHLGDFNSEQPAKPRPRPLQDEVSANGLSTPPADSHEAAQLVGKQMSLQEDSEAAGQDAGSADEWGDDDAWGEPSFQEANLNGEVAQVAAGSGEIQDLGTAIAEQPLPAADQEAAESQAASSSIQTNGAHELQGVPEGGMQA